MVAYGIYRIDSGGIIRSWNTGAERITGIPAADAIGHPYARLFDADSVRERVPQKALLFTRENQHLRDEHTRCRADGSRFTARVTLDTARNAEGVIIGFVEVFFDISDDKAREHALYQRATRDPLTGIFNRGHFTELAQQEIDRARRFHEPLSLAILDIDHFKQINDRYGHAAGDEAIVQVTRTVANSIRRIDAVGRIGGEEFAVLLPRASVEAAGEMLQRLRLALSQVHIAAEAHRFQLTVSMGVAQLTADAPDLASLMRRADTALYRAKHEGRNQVQIWRGPG